MDIRKLFSKSCILCTVFQHDRDRILHCKAFRRFKYSLLPTDSAEEAKIYSCSTEDEDLRMTI